MDENRKKNYKKKHAPHTQLALVLISDTFPILLEIYKNDVEVVKKQFQNCYCEVSQTV